MKLEHNKLDITKLRGSLQGGVFQGNLHVDASQAVPLVAVTDEGTTIGNGVLNLGTERLTLTLAGEPAQPRLFKLSMPVLVQGPLTRPSVSVLPSRNARKLGLKGTLGMSLSPIAALLPLGRDPRPTAKC